MSYFKNNKKLNILQISPLYESVPPKYYGGTERVVSYLTESLVEQGHNVTLFASGDSLTKAKLISPCVQSIRLNKSCIDQLAYHVLMMEKVLQIASDFDVIHSHIDYLPFPHARRQLTPWLTTLHGRLDIPDLLPLFNEFKEMPVVSISNSQRSPLSFANWQDTVYHGLPKDLYTFNNKQGKYLAFIGRISPEKGVDKAIEIAIKSGMELKIAAKVDKVDTDYFNSVIKPLLNHDLIEYIGEIGEEEKNKFLGNAYALLFPVDWPEPFGLAMIEALACGTPVIARRRGSVPEIIEDGVNGFIFNNTEDAFQLVEKVQYLSRERCRKDFENRFTNTTMSSNYLKVYERLIMKNKVKVLEHTPILIRNSSWNRQPTYKKSFVS